MIKNILLLLCFLVSTNAIAYEYRFCKDQIDAAMSVLKNVFKKNGALTLDSRAPCERCDMTGIHDFSIEDTNFLMQNLSRGSYELTLNLTFHKLQLKCECELNYEFQKIPLSIEKGFQENEFKNCNQETQKQIMKEIKSKGYKQMSLKKMSNLKACKNPKRNPNLKNDLSSGHMIIEWAKLNVSLTFRYISDDYNVNIDSINILNENFNDITVYEDPHDKNFKSAYHCFKATGFYIQLMTDIIYSTKCAIPLPKNYARILQYFVCFFPEDY